MRIEIRSNVDPKDLRINHRYTDVRKVPPLIAKAYKQLTSDAEEAGREAGVIVPKDSKIRLKLEVWYTWNDMRADIDGPHKRTQDAIAAGLNFNDNRIDDVHIHRTEVGVPGIHAILETIGNDAGINRKDEEDDDWFIFAGDSYIEEVR